VGIGTGAGIGRYLLPVIIPPISLRQLRIEIDEMARKEEVILRLDGQGVSHECARVHGQRSGECARDTVTQLLVSPKQRQPCYRIFKVLVGGWGCHA
jgi:hypothetical protein